jgi:hypothetical protein
MHVAGGNSLANVTSFTPGGRRCDAGVERRLAQRRRVRPVTATAYSVAQQLVGTAWNIIFAPDSHDLGPGAGPAASGSSPTRTPTRSAGRPEQQENRPHEEGGEEGPPAPGEPGPGRPVSSAYGEAPAWTPERPRSPSRSARAGLAARRGLAGRGDEARPGGRRTRPSAWRWRPQRSSRR